MKDEDEDGKRRVGRSEKKEKGRVRKESRMGTGEGTAVAAMKILYKEY